MNISTDTISTIADKAVAAVIAFVPVNSMCVDGPAQAYHLLDREAASAFITECTRASTGPIALLLLHGADAWAGVMVGHGLQVQRQTYLSGMLDLVIASAGPTIKLPRDDMLTVRQLIEGITRYITMKGGMKLTFAECLRELKSSGYRVAARLLNAKYYGVPQGRERLIFIGVRDDLGIDPTHPAPFSRPITAREAIADVVNDPAEHGIEVAPPPVAGSPAESKSRFFSSN